MDYKLFGRKGSWWHNQTTIIEHLPGQTKEKNHKQPQPVKPDTSKKQVN
jgi:hypothetical protein